MDLSLSRLKIIALVLFILILIAVGSAGAYYYFVVEKDTPPTSDGDNNTGSATVNLTWWGLWEEEATMQALIDRYKDTNPNVNITYAKRESLTAQDTASAYKNSLLKLYQNSDPVTPDIVTMNNSWLPQFQNYLAPLPDSVYTSGEYKATFYNHAVESCTGTDGSLYCIPADFEGLAVYYNKDLLKNKGYDLPAVSWEDLTEQAIALTTFKANGEVDVSGLAFGRGGNVTHSAEVISVLLLQRDEKISVGSVGLYQASIDKNVGAEVLDYYMAFSKNYKMWNDTLPVDKQMFIEGKLAMMFAPSWFAFNIAESRPDLNYGTAPIPQVVNLENQRTDWANYSVYGVSRNSRNSSTAMDFVKFLSEPEQYRLLNDTAMTTKSSRIFGIAYPRKDMASEITEELLLPYIESAPTAKAVYVKDQEAYFGALKNAIDTGSSGSGAYTKFIGDFNIILQRN